MMRAQVGVVLALGVVYTVALVLVNRDAPEAYMDEIFHIPQTQKYCAGRFEEWDPKITTFPGLYVFSTLYAHGVAAVSDAAFCSTPVLRSINVLFAVGNAFLFMKLRTRIVPSDSHPITHALMLATFPIHFFFTFLFYTDSGAIFFVLLMYYLAERVDLRIYPSARGSYVLSALTNIIWVAFVAGTVVVKCVELSHGSYIYGARRVFINFLVVVCTNVVSLLQLVWPFVAIAAAFVVFLVKNGGIVVGDKSNHQAGFHGAQILYFIVVLASGFGISLFTPGNVKRFADSVHRNAKDTKGLLFIVCVVVTMLLVIVFFSPVHPFMLADNRHYTFYIWRKFFLKHPLAKYLPGSLYLFFGWRCWTELRRHRSPLWMLVYAIAVSLVLVPSPLV
uniref:Dol-P-Glc:Glc(2)Man(9)GlcNAc(2)-PP-Dol alpha-1,2-glucosyltransferase n=1 Tax=Globisporangium ultimum (strain ATCC 200006 / CBS 805.95 / DAOM BR144) TaxID=431595 RepID=K3W7E6_GLOUD